MKPSSAQELIDETQIVRVDWTMLNNKIDEEIRIETIKLLKGGRIND